MLEYGIATPEELAAGHALAPVKKAARTVTAADMTDMVRCGSPYNRPAPAPALFKAGDKVRARNMHPKTHTRLPRYARGHAGEVVRIVGCHVFPDANASNAGEDPHWLYTVRFDGRELWGADADPTVTVSIDAWEPYLERADDRPRRSSAARTQAVPSIPRDADGPVFREPWEAQAFAMTLALHERGLFTWARMGGGARRRNQARARRGRSRHRRDLLLALAHRAGEAGRPRKA